jgi:hypothetical protein
MPHKTFVTFGQTHAHHVNGETFDHNCVAVIESEGPVEGRTKAFELFGCEFCFEYPEKYWDEEKLKYFPRGYINATSK